MKSIIVLLIILSISAVAERQEKDTKEVTDKDIPRNDQRVVHALLEMLSEDEQKEIKKTGKEVNEENILQIILAKAKVMQNVE